MWASFQYVSGGAGVGGTKLWELLFILDQNDKSAVSLVSTSSGVECEAWRVWVWMCSMSGESFAVVGVVVGGVRDSAWSLEPILGVGVGVVVVVNFSRVGKLRDAQSFIGIVSRGERVGTALSTTCGRPAGPRSARKVEIVRFW